MALAEKARSSWCDSAPMAAPGRGRRTATRSRTSRRSPGPGRRRSPPRRLAAGLARHVHQEADQGLQVRPVDPAGVVRRHRPRPPARRGLGAGRHDRLQHVRAGAAGQELVRSGPITPVDPAAASVWQLPHPWATQTSSPARVATVAARAGSRAPAASPPPSPSPPATPDDKRHPATRHRGGGRRAPHARRQDPNGDPRGRDDAAIPGGEPPGERPAVAADARRGDGRRRGADRPGRKPCSWSM